MLLTSLRQAVESGNGRILRLLVKRGVNPVLFDFVAIEPTIKHGPLNILRMLVEYGASIPRAYYFKLYLDMLSISNIRSCTCT
jgi:hypothetical protein